MADNTIGNVSGCFCFSGYDYCTNDNVCVCEKTTTEITQEENRKERNKTTSKGRKED